jgi:hypothetical protein
LPNTSAEELGLLGCLNLLDKKRLIKTYILVSSTQGFLMGVENPNHLRAMDKNEFPFLGQETWEFFVKGGEFDFKVKLGSHDSPPFLHAGSLPRLTAVNQLFTLAGS